MRRYLVLLPAPEAEWAALPAEEHVKGMQLHEQFQRDLGQGGHWIVTASPLTPSAQALSMRPDGQGGAVITDGPFAESVEQLAGFYLIDSNDRDDLVRCCAQLASTGDFIELRKLADDGDDVSGAPEPNSTDTANPTDLTNATNPTDTPLEGPLP
ncbi:MAG TPA: YciI family protein [Dermatophilaceae bacterium]|nr:YciI family protein [Dermatophilaceae bacterium]